jgi:ABC-type glycerol-3-phosphate transport system substrate-binding protein
VSRPVRWLLAALAAEVLVVLSCAPAHKAPQVQEIVFWQSWPVEVVAPIVAEFEAARPGLKVRVERLAAPVGRERVLAALVADSVPDLCQIASDSMPGLLAGNRLADWSAGVADLRPRLYGWEMCSVGDALYGVPWVLAPRVLYFNVTLLARARLDPNRAPETWDELYRAASAVQRLGRGVRGFGMPVGEPAALREQLLPLLFANGGSLLSGDLRGAAFDSAANVEALEFLVRLRRVSRVAGRDSIEREFLAGRIGFVLAGPRLLGEVARRNGAPGGAVGLVPAPRRDTLPVASWADGEVLVSFNDAKRKHLALDLARFLVQPENAERLARAVRSVVPATVGADTLPRFRDSPGVARMIRQLAGARYAPDHPAWGAMEAAIEDEVEQALDGRKSAARAVKDAQTKLAELVGKR